MPVLAARLPDVVARLGESAEQAGRNNVAWDALLDALPDLEPRRERDGVSVAAHALARYDSALAEAIARALGRRAGCTIGRAGAGRLIALAAGGRSGSTVPLGAGWGGEVAFGRLAVRRLPVIPAETARIEAGVGEVAWGRWRFRVSEEPAPARQARAALTAWFEGTLLTVRHPRAGDRIRPLGGPGRRPVVKCFMDARVSRLARRAWPVVEAAGSVVWVPGVCRAEAFVPPAGSEALRVDVTYE